MQRRIYAWRRAHGSWARLNYNLLMRVREAEGEAAGLVLPVWNTAAKNLHLAEIFQAVATDAHAVVLIDQAGWHTSDRPDLPSNISIVLLPPKSPELNPTENTWQFMCDNWLSYRVFRSADDIVDHRCAAWNKLVAQPRHIMSIGMRRRAHGFRSTTIRITTMGLACDRVC